LAGWYELGGETLNYVKEKLFDQLSEYQQISFVKFTDSHVNTLKFAAISETLLCAYLHKNYDNEAKSNKQSSDFTSFALQISVLPHLVAATKLYLRKEPH